MIPKDGCSDDRHLTVKTVTPYGVAFLLLVIYTQYSDLLTKLITTFHTAYNTVQLYNILLSCPVCSLKLCKGKVPNLKMRKIS